MRVLFPSGVVQEMQPPAAEPQDSSRGSIHTVSMWRGTPASPGVSSGRQRGEARVWGRECGCVWEDEGEESAGATFTCPNSWTSAKGISRATVVAGGAARSSKPVVVAAVVVLVSFHVQIPCRGT